MQLGKILTIGNNLVKSTNDTRLVEIFYKLKDNILHLFGEVKYIEISKDKQKYYVIYELDNYLFHSPISKKDLNKYKNVVKLNENEVLPRKFDVLYKDTHKNINLSLKQVILILDEIIERKINEK